MAEDWTKAKRLDERSECLVFGFVRESQMLLNNDDSYSIITDLIIWIILSFYDIKDEWDKVYADESYKIDGTMLTKTGSKNVATSATCISIT